MEKPGILRQTFSDVASAPPLSTSAGMPFPVVHFPGILAWRLEAPVGLTGQVGLVYGKLRLNLVHSLDHDPRLAFSSKH